jgi:hypothetical protein
MDKNDGVFIEKDSILDHLSGGILNGRKQECCIENCNAIAYINTVYGLLCGNHDKRITDYRNGKDVEAGKLQRKTF